MRSTLAGLSLLLVPVSTACGGPAEPPVTVEATDHRPAEAAKPTATANTTAEPSNGDYATKLADARKVRDEFLARPVPKAPKVASKENAMRFVQTEVKAWYEDARPRVESAEAAYDLAHMSASTGAERVVALSEVGDVETTFIERFLAVGNSGMPGEWRANAELSMVYKDSLYEAVSPYIGRAKKMVVLCDKASPGEAKCKAVSTRLDTIERAGPARTVPPP